MLILYVIPYKKENKTKRYSLFFTPFYFSSSLSLRNTSNALSRFVKRSHTIAVRDCWIQRYRPERLFFKKTKISEFVADDTQIKVGFEYIWLWVAIEYETKNIVAINISKERNIFVAESGFYTMLLKNMENIQYLQTVAQVGSTASL